MGTLPKNRDGSAASGRIKAGIGKWLNAKCVHTYRFLASLTHQVKGDYGRAFNRALEIRMEADYEALREFNKEEAEEIIQEAERFFNEVKPICQG